MKKYNISSDGGKGGEVCHNWDGYTSIHQHTSLAVRMRMQSGLRHRSAEERCHRCFAQPSKQSQSVPTCSQPS
jgi:hypothetical protein